MEIGLGAHVDAPGGLVAEQHPRLDGEPFADDHALLVATGEGPRARAEQTTWQPDPIRAGRGELRGGAPHREVRYLSGGNQQKVVLAKWLATGPRLLIVDEPTRGIDVGTKAEVHRLMSSLAADGIAIVMVSSELPEVLGMADRIIVLREGRVAATLTRAEATEESVMYAAMGQEAAA